MTVDRHYYIDSFDTVALSSFRVEQSPLRSPVRDRSDGLLHVLRPPVPGQEDP